MSSFSSFCYGTSDCALISDPCRFDSCLFEGPLVFRQLPGYNPSSCKSLACHRTLDNLDYLDPLSSLTNLLGPPSWFGAIAIDLTVLSSGTLPPCFVELGALAATNKTLMGPGSTCGFGPLRAVCPWEHQSS